MPKTANLDAMFDSQFKAVRKLFDEEGAYEEPCLLLLENPALPHFVRVSCWVSLENPVNRQSTNTTQIMISMDPSNADFCVKEATGVLDKIDTMIEKGEFGASFQFWVDRARGNFEKVKKHHLENAVNGGEDSGAIPQGVQRLAEGEDEEENTTTITA